MAASCSPRSASSSANSKRASALMARSGNAAIRAWYWCGPGLRRLQRHGRERHDRHRHGRRRLARRRLLGHLVACASATAPAASCRGPPHFQVGQCPAAPGRLVHHPAPRLAAEGLLLLQAGPPGRPGTVAASWSSLTPSFQGLVGRGDFLGLEVRGWPASSGPRRSCCWPSSFMHCPDRRAASVASGRSGDCFTTWSSTARASVACRPRAGQRPDGIAAAGPSRSGPGLACSFARDCCRHWASTSAASAALFWPRSSVARCSRAIGATVAFLRGSLVKRRSSLMAPLTSPAEADDTLAARRRPAGPGRCWRNCCIELLVGGPGGGQGLGLLGRLGQQCRPALLTVAELEQGVGRLRAVRLGADVALQLLDGRLEDLPRACRPPWRRRPWSGPAASGSRPAGRARWPARRCGRPAGIASSFSFAFSRSPLR